MNLCYQLLVCSTIDVKVSLVYWPGQTPHENSRLHQGEVSDCTGAFRNRLSNPQSHSMSFRHWLCVLHVRAREGRYAYASSCCAVASIKLTHSILSVRMCSLQEPQPAPQSCEGHRRRPIGGTLRWTLFGGTSCWTTWIGCCGKYYGTRSLFRLRCDVTERRLLRVACVVM